MAELLLHLDKLRQNLDTVLAFAKARNLDLLLVTKVIQSRPDLLTLINHPALSRIADLHAVNLAKLPRGVTERAHLRPRVSNALETARHCDRVFLSDTRVAQALAQARESLGPIQRPYRYRSLNQESANEWVALGGVAELDVEETLFQRELMYQVRMEKNHGLVIVLDTSLSMKGEKLALLGVTVAAAHESIPSEALCILGFDSEIHVIKDFQEKIPTEMAIGRVLSIPAGGFTNIDLGLKAAAERIAESNLKDSRVILISDGRYTEGKNPVIRARDFRMIYPVKIGKDPGGRAVMREIADTGQGRFSEVREMHELPRFLLHAIRTWVK